MIERAFAAILMDKGKRWAWNHGIWMYPDTNGILVLLSVGYVVVYALISLYRTFVPLEGVSLENENSSKFYIPKKGPKNNKADRGPG